MTKTEEIEELEKVWKNVPDTEFGGDDDIPVDDSRTGKGGNAHYVLLVKAEDFAGEFVVAIEHGETMSYLVEQLEWDILRNSRHVEWTKIIKVPAGVAHTYEIDVAFRDGLISALYGEKRKGNIYGDDE